MKRWILAGLIAALVVAGIIHEVWWSRTFDDEEVRR